MYFDEYNLNFVLSFFLYTMNDTLPTNSEQPAQTTIDHSLSSENSDDASPEQMKFTIKQRLWRLLMTTEIKDKSLVPNLIEIKNNMYENFCRTWVWESSYINKIFWLYANKDQDIKIVKPQLKLFSQYPLNVPDVSDKEAIRVTQYIKTLRFIREWLQSTMQGIRPLVADAKQYAEKQVRKENVDTFHTNFDMEDEKQNEHTLAKQHLQTSMLSQKYDIDGHDYDWFRQEQTIISDTFAANNYQDLMIFALLWFHYFNKKSEVYDAFLPEQLETQKITFTLPDFHPTTLSLWAFLKIIEHLDFKRHLFSV